MSLRSAYALLREAVSSHAHVVLPACNSVEAAIRSDLPQRDVVVADIVEHLSQRRRRDVKPVPSPTSEGDEGLAAPETGRLEQARAAVLQGIEGDPQGHDRVRHVVEDPGEKHEVEGILEIRCRAVEQAAVAHLEARDVEATPQVVGAARVHRDLLDGENASTHGREQQARAARPAPYVEDPHACEVRGQHGKAIDELRHVSHVAVSHLAAQVERPEVMVVAPLETGCAVLADGELLVVRRGRVAGTQERPKRSFEVIGIDVDQRADRVSAHQRGQVGFRGQGSVALSQGGWPTPGEQPPKPGHPRGPCDDHDFTLNHESALVPPFRPAIDARLVYRPSLSSLKPLGVGRSVARLLADLYVRRGPAVLVYQMGKVGSMSIASSLRACGMQRVFRLHKLQPDNYRDDPIGQRVVSMLVRRRFVRDDSARVRVISPIRDPVSRNVSAFFQNLHRFVDEPSRACVRDLQQAFIDRYRHDAVANWFETELHRTLGIDVYGHEFDPAVGHARLSQGRIDLLLFKIELPDATITRLLADLLELDSLTLTGANEAATKKGPGYDLYEPFRKTLVLPDELADSIYDSKFAQHFYTPEERAEARARWTTVAEGRTVARGG